MFERELAVAIEAARKGAAAAIVHYHEGTEVQWKDGKEPLTAADLASNEAVLEVITAAFPDDAILSEEVKDDRSRLGRERVWVVDPLDGTREFVDRVGQFVVMVGLAVAGEPVVGALCQPTTDRVWYGVAGQGAFVVEADGTERALAVTEREQADGLRLVLTRSHLFEGVETIKQELAIEEIQQIGSVGLKVAAIVEGDADLYVHISQYTKEWDTCAPQAILEAAGGSMTDLWGRRIVYNRDDVYNRGGVLASNGTSAHAACQRACEPIASSELKK